MVREEGMGITTRRRGGHYARIRGLDLDWVVGGVTTSKVRLALAACCKREREVYVTALMFSCVSD